MGRERCAIAAQGTIETLNDLFAALFKPGEGEAPIIGQPVRPLREDLFARFFPDALVAQFADRSKSNLTWFFNSDARNKSVRRALVALLREDPRRAVDDAHRKAREVLWPAPGRPAFDGERLRAALGRVRVPSALNGRFHITEAGDDGPSRMDRFYAVDEAAALSRALLTLAVAGDAPADTVGEIWRSDGGDCGFMRADESVAGRLRYCRMLDLQGRYDRAFEGYQRLAKQLDGPAKDVDESTLYCRLGEMLFTGEGCLRDEKAAQEYDRRGCLDENPRSWFQLAQHVSGTGARQAMERAVELGYGPAIRQLGMAWYNGSARLATLRSADSARRVFQKGLSLPGADGAYCAYMLGRIYEAQNDRDAAVNAYRLAQEGGSAEAAERLAGLDWMLAPKPPEAGIGRRAAIGAPKYCLTNGLTGCNRLLRESLQGRWEVTALCEVPAEAAPEGVRVRGCPPEVALRELAQGVYWGGAPEFPELVIALMSEDRHRNLFQAVALLGELQRLAQSLGERAWDLADQAQMYILADRDVAGPLLDAAFAGMGPLYFQVRLCDPALDAADRLFAAAPLFLPRLKAPEDAPVRLKLIGDGDEALALLRRAVALPLPEAARYAVDVYGREASALARRFYQLCPGMADAGALGGTTPRFHDCDPALDLLSALDGDDLALGDYYVVAAGDDGLNLRLGMLLRGELTKRRLESGEVPFIAAYTRDPTAQWLAGSLSAGPEAGQGGYELYAFGALDMYGLRQLQADPLERRAQQAHMLFIGLPNTKDARHAALGSYYKRQLVRDAARATAQSLIYRMHLAGVSLPGWRLYGVPEEEARLGEAYTRWLRQDDHLAQALRDEHLRRNRALLAQGWAPATVEQVAAYVRRGNPGHILHAARLNPFICPWEALESGELLQKVRDAVRARYPEKSVPDPRREEERSVLDTEHMLDGSL